MLTSGEIEAICRGDHSDPFGVLGLHADSDGMLWVRTFQPDARAVYVIDISNGNRLAELECKHPNGFFEAPIPRRRNRFG